MKTKSSLHFILMIALLLVAAEPEQQLSARSSDAEDRQLHRHREFLNQDACATESMGPIVDRTKEHLGASDSYVIQVRRFLLKAVKDLQGGKQPPGLVYDAAQADFARIRCDVAYLWPNVSWRTFFDDKVTGS